MIIGIGVDLVHVPRIEQAVNRYGDRFLCRLFTARERERYDNKDTRQRMAGYAKLFAAKEACVKALGTGFTQGVEWHHMEIFRQGLDAPTVHLNGRAQEVAREKAGENYRVHLSLTDEWPYCQAMIIIEKGSE